MKKSGTKEWILGRRRDGYIVCRVVGFDIIPRAQWI